MGLIQIDLFTTLDGVAQAPGGRDEDPSGGFAFGGWQAPFQDEIMGERVVAETQKLDALLLGRRTYEMFASYWPFQDNAIAAAFNRVPKYVASRHPLDLPWANSTLLGPDLAAEIKTLRDRHEEIHVYGSLNFIQSLFGARLFDRLRLFVYPILLGPGKRAFEGGALPSNLTLIEPAITEPTGAVLLRYELAEGTPATGQMGEAS